MAINSILNIAALPLDISDANPDANLNQVRQHLVKLAPDTDVVILPELFSTGFTADKAKLSSMAESITGNTVSEIKKLAATYNVAIAGSFLAKTASKIYNRAFFIEPSGDETFYDKRHLFGISAEASLLSQGDRLPATVRFRGWNLALTVCYDLRFPAWCRNIDNRYDALIVAANWPSARAYAWEHLLIARAIENQAYVIGANRGGNDKFGSYDNLTFIYDFLGKPVALKDKDCDFIYAVLDKDKLDIFRDNFPVWKDSDSFDIY